MVSIFLEKDSKDRCLDRIGEFADRYEFGGEPSEDEKILIDNFTQLCFDVIRSSVGDHVWGSSTVDTKKMPAKPMQPRLLVPKEES